MRKPIRRRLRTLLWAALLLALTTAGWLLYFAATALELPQLPYSFTLKHGSSLKSVARQLTAARVLPEPWRFTLLVRLSGKAGEIKAGNYLLERPVSPLQLQRMITRGEVSQSEIAFIEGWTFRQMRKALDEHADLVHETRGLSEQQIMALLGAPEAHPEGQFFPDTYFFSSGMSDLSILRRARQTLQARLDEAWRGRAPDLLLRDSYQALILASIVEKETGLASERPLIAAVFLNRLRRGMRLQTDPTVIYGMGEGFDGDLRRQDLARDTPYNTYTRAGLPPTPIAMPGWEALQAALHPANSPALYFVSKGNGSHQFSATLENHNRAVARFQKRSPAEPAHASSIN